MSSKTLLWVSLLSCLSATLAASPEVRIIQANGSAPFAPHEAYLSRATTLKAATNMQGPHVSVTWDFGDGTSISSRVVTDAFDASAVHAYRGTEGALYVATVTVANSETNESSSAQYPIVLVDAHRATEAMRNRIWIEEQRWSLHLALQRGTPLSISDTADAVRLFESGGIPSGDHPYSESLRIARQRVTGATNAQSPAASKADDTTRAAAPLSPLRLISSTSDANGVPTTTASNDQSISPSISDDGDKITFLSQASNVTPATDANTWNCAPFNPTGPLPTTRCATSRDMYLRVVSADRTRLITHRDGTTAFTGNLGFNGGEMTADGRFGAYVGVMGSNLHQENKPGCNPNTQQQDLTADCDPAFLGDTKFRADFTNLNASPFVTLTAHPKSNATTLATGNFDTNTSVGISADGNYLAYDTASNGTPLTNAVNGSPLTLSNANGRKVILRSDTASPPRNVLVSHHRQAVASACDGDSFGSKASGNGSKVVFLSYCTDLITGQTGPPAPATQAQVFLWDAATNGNVLVSHAESGLTAASDAAASDARVSADGKFVFFQSTATNLVAGVSGQQIYRYNVATRAIDVVSQRTGTGGFGNGSSAMGGARFISDDNRYLVFTSNSTNLERATNSDGVNTFLRDFIDNKTFPINHRGASSLTYRTIGRPSISASGRIVVFGDNGASEQVTTPYTKVGAGLFVRDMGSRFTVTNLVSRSSGFATTSSNGTGASGIADINAGGTRVVFESASTDHVDGVTDTNGVMDIYAADFPRQYPQVIELKLNGVLVSEEKIVAPGTTKFSLTYNWNLHFAGATPFSRAGNLDFSATDSPANYRMVQTNNGVFTVTSCASPLGPNETDIPIFDVTYDPKGFEFNPIVLEPGQILGGGYTTTLNTGPRVTNTKIRIFACARTGQTGAIVDAANGGLDGNGDGIPGDDFATDYRVGPSPTVASVFGINGTPMQNNGTYVGVTSSIAFSYDYDVIGGDVASNFKLILDPPPNVSCADTGIPLTASYNRPTYTTHLNVPRLNGRYELLVCLTGITGSGNGVSGLSTRRFSFTVIGRPEIVNQPTDKANCAGLGVTFSATVTGATSQQWFVSTDNGATFTAVPGGTNAALVVPAITQAQNGHLYKAIFSNDAGSVETNVVRLSITDPPLAQPPSSQTVPFQGTATFTVLHKGGTTFQWQVSTNGGASFADVTGATSATLSFAAQLSDNGKLFRLVVSNNCGTVTTSAALLTVDPSPFITTNPVNVTVNSGGTATFTAAAVGSPLPTVQWQFKSPGAPGFVDLFLATSTTMFFANANATHNGTQFRAVFTNNNGTATTTVATLTVNFAPTVTTNPVSQTAPAGSVATFTAAASGNPAPTVQWQQKIGAGAFTNIPGATSPSLTVPADSARNGSQYQAVFTNSVGAATTTPATLTVTPPPFTVNAGVPVFNRTTGRFSQTVTVTNTGLALASSAFALDNLAAGFTVFTPSGVTSLALPAGSPYIEMGAVGAGASVTFTIQFTRVGTPALTYTPRILAGSTR